MNKLLTISSLIICLIVSACDGIGGNSDTSSNNNGFGITSVLPTENSSVSPATTFKIGFNNNVDSSTLGSVKLINATSKQPEHISCNIIDKTSIECIPQAKLQLDSQYNLLLTGIHNIAHNTMNDTTIIYNSYTQPKVTKITPESGNISVNATIFSILFSESMDVNTLNSNTTRNNVLFADINSGESINISCTALNALEMQCTIPSTQLINGNLYSLDLTNNILSQKEMPIISESFVYKSLASGYTWNSLGNTFQNKIARLDLTSNNDLYVSLQNNISIFKYDTNNWKVINNISPLPFYSYLDPDGNVYGFYTNNFSYQQLINQTWSTIGVNIGYPFPVTDCMKNLCISYPSSYNGTIILSDGRIVNELNNGNVINITPTQNESFAYIPRLSKKNYFSGDYDPNNLQWGMYTSSDYTQADGNSIFYRSSMSDLFLYSNNKWKNITYDFPKGIGTQYLENSTAFLENNNNLYVIADLHKQGIKAVFRLDNDHWTKIFQDSKVDFRAVSIDDNNLYFANGHNLYNLNLSTLLLTDISPTGYISQSDQIKSVIVKNNNLYIATENSVLMGEVN